MFGLRAALEPPDPKTYVATYNGNNHYTLSIRRVCGHTTIAQVFARTEREVQDHVRRVQRSSCEGCAQNAPRASTRRIQAPIRRTARLSMSRRIQGFLKRTLGVPGG